MLGFFRARAALEVERRLHADTRAQLERATEAATRATDLASRAMDRAEELRQQLDKVTSALVEMKREGFVMPPKPEQLAPVESEIPDTVEQAIRLRAPRGSELERDLRRWAASEIRAGKEAGNVVTAIIRGGGPADEEELG